VTGVENGNRPNRGVAASVPCFVKQLGRTVLIPNGSFSEWPREGDDLIHADEDNPNWRVQGELVGVQTRHPKGGDPSEWPEDLRVRHLPGDAEQGT